MRPHVLLLLLCLHVCSTVLGLSPEEKLRLGEMHLQKLGFYTPETEEVAHPAAQKIDTPPQRNVISAQEFISKVYIAKKTVDSLRYRRQEEEKARAIHSKRLQEERETQIKEARKQQKGSMEGPTSQIVVKAQRRPFTLLDAGKLKAGLAVHRGTIPPRSHMYELMLEKNAPLPILSPSSEYIHDSKYISQQSSDAYELGQLHRKMLEL